MLAVFLQPEQLRRVCDSNAGPLEGEAALPSSKLLWGPGRQRVQSRSKEHSLNVVFLPFLVILQAFSDHTVAELNKYSHLLTNSVLCN